MASDSQPLLIATTNAGKLGEIRDVLSPLSISSNGDASVEQAPITLLSLRDLPPIDEPEETGQTYAENARLKALYYAACSGLMTVAEDSGLMIDALDGEPGLLSARFAKGRFDLAFEEIFRRLEAKGVHESPARFICALALVHDDRIIFESEGIVDGVVKPPPRGEGGFGYDPIFYYPPLGQTMAELPAIEKHRVSHRGKAFAALRDFLERTIMRLGLEQ